MRPILKRLDVGSANERREIVQDDTRVVPLAELKSSPGAGLGVRLSPADQVEDLRDDLERLSVVEIEFPSAGEGRGFSQARLLRSARYGFKGELRAVGAGVKQDLLFLMARCGLDAFELAPGQKLEEALRAFERYHVAYQPAEPLAAIKQQRFHAAV
jgi:uncharacterized protein (DUF934 family)